MRAIASGCQIASLVVSATGGAYYFLERLAGTAIDFNAVCCLLSCIAPSTALITKSFNVIPLIAACVLARRTKSAGKSLRFIVLVSMAQMYHLIPPLSSSGSPRLPINSGLRYNAGVLPAGLEPATVPCERTALSCLSYGSTNLILSYSKLLSFETPLCGADPNSSRPAIGYFSGSEFHNSHPFLARFCELESTIAFTRTSHKRASLRNARNTKTTI